MDQVVDAAAAGQGHAVDADILPGRIDPSAQLRDEFAVDLHAAGQDQLFALAAAAQTRRGENLLQTIASRLVRRGRFAVWGAVTSAR
jgi:hypothetical protein